MPARWQLSSDCEAVRLSDFDKCFWSLVMIEFWQHNFFYYAIFLSGEDLLFQFSQQWLNMKKPVLNKWNWITVFYGGKLNLWIEVYIKKPPENIDFHSRLSCQVFLRNQLLRYSEVVLTCLVKKHMQTFSDSLWRRFLILIYCDLLTISWFPN